MAPDFTERLKASAQHQLYLALLPFTHARQAEINNTQTWAQRNNLSLNSAKSAEIIFVDPRRKRHNDPPLLLDIARVDSLKILGDTFTRNLSASEHIGNIVKSCSQSLYALQLLRAHGFCNTAIQTIFRAVIIAKLTYVRLERLHQSLRSSAY